MSNSAGEPPDPASTTVAVLPPVKKTGGGVLVILFAVLGAGVATVAVLMSRGIATPPAAAASAPAAAPASPRPAMTKAAEPSKWASGARWVSDRKSVAFELKANNRVAVWMGQVQPSLVVRCVSNRTEVFVFTETAAKIEPGMEDRAVRVRLDDEPYVEERWPDSEEHKGLFAPHGETLAQRLVNARTLRFEFTPHNASPAEVQFNVAGLRDLIEPVQKKCGWKQP